MTGRPADAWASGSAYEPFIGRWSRRIAGPFLEWLDAPPDGAWLDVGCGTGALTHTVLEQARPASIVGVDPSPAFVDHTRRTTDDPRVSFRVGDARQLEDDDGTYDVAVSALVMNFVPEPERAVAEQRRVTRSGGLVAAYVWDYVHGGMQLLHHFWQAATALDGAAADLDEARRFPLCDPLALESLFAGAGLDDVAVTDVTVPTVFRDFDDYWTPFLGGQGPAPTYVASLDDGRRTALRDAVRERLPVAGDGSIALTARAWAARGVS
jgi:SAM-dependent methyltransferase